MLQEIITKIEQSIQCVLCYLLNLCFQPIYTILTIIQNLVEIWSADEEEEETEEPTVYPEPTHIAGFKAQNATIKGQNAE